MSGLYESPDPAVTACPTTSMPCPGLEFLVQIYTEHADSELVSGAQSHADRLLLDAKMTEYNLRAKTMPCPGPGEVCPVRTVMDESRPRQAVVTGIRSLIGLRTILGKKEG